jgi:hypothetical protein
VEKFFKADIKPLEIIKKAETILNGDRALSLLYNDLIAKIKM